MGVFLLSGLLLKEEKEKRQKRMNLGEANFIHMKVKENVAT